MEKITEKKMVETEVTVGFKAVDGKMFESEYACLNYEKELKYADRIRFTISSDFPCVKLINYNDNYYYGCKLTLKDEFDNLLKVLKKNSNMHLQGLMSFMGDDIYFFKKISDGGYSSFSVSSLKYEKEKFEKFQKAFTDEFDEPVNNDNKSKLGKWIISSDGYYPYCSECKEVPEDGIVANVCPSCGIKMNESTIV